MRAFQDECEEQPDKFIIYEYPRYLDEAREAVAKVRNYTRVLKPLAL